MKILRLTAMITRFGKLENEKKNYNGDIRIQLKFYRRELF